MQRTDVLVIGSGIAGLTFALQVADQRSVAIVTKKNKAESNTNYAQGGIACVTSEEDSFELHVRDTLEAGAGLCREDVVREIVQEGPARIQELIMLGMAFAERDNGEGGFDLGKEGGHSKRRILHARDVTGREVEKALLVAIAGHPNIQVYENHLAVNLITKERLGLATANRCLGAYVYDVERGRVETFAAHHVLLATGGCGQVYLHTTNPEIATGDGVSMAYRAGCKVANMEFIQFHPTSLHHHQVRSFLISEALRGEGGELIDRQGNAFMQNYDPRKSLAPRDIVARAIDAEMKKSGAPCVYLDMTAHSGEALRDRFPNIYHTCKKLGLRLEDEPIPVVPAAHYQCGGVLTDTNGRTNLPGLFAVGEVACTGLHGANRLASNSLLEALVCAYRAGRSVLDDARDGEKMELPEWEVGAAVDPDELVVIKHNWQEVQQLMWDYVGIVRTTKRLMRAGKRLHNLSEEVKEFYWRHKLTADLIELRSLVLVASLIVDCALKRKESRGLHYTLDYPQTDAQASLEDTVLDRYS
ncbi:MAG: L-aspartate oxidase [Verrucomicrobiota bacterium]